MAKKKMNEQRLDRVRDKLKILDCDDATKFVEKQRREQKSYDEQYESITEPWWLGYAFSHLPVEFINEKDVTRQVLEHFAPGNPVVTKILEEIRYKEAHGKYETPYRHKCTLLFEALGRDVMRQLEKNNCAEIYKTLHESCGVDKAELVAKLKELVPASLIQEAAANFADD